MKAAVEKKTAAARRKEIEDFLTEKGIPIGSTKMDTKKPAGGNGQTGITITTNIYPIEVNTQAQIFRYRVDIVGITAKKEWDITRQFASDYLRIKNRARCAVSFLAFWEKMKQRDSNKFNCDVYYDCKNTVYSLKELQQVEETITLDEANTVYELPELDVLRYRVTISNVEGSPVMFNLRDFIHITSNAEPGNRSSEQFVDVATSQNVFNNPAHFIHYSTAISYLLAPAEYGFKDECPLFRANDSFLGIGIGKGARVIEGTRPEEPALALVINVVKSPFHIHEEMLAKISVLFPVMKLSLADNGALDMLNKYFRGIWVETSYLPHQSFPIFNIVKETAQMVKLDPDTTVEDHFKKKGINLRHPDYPLVVRRGAEGNLSHFPIEVLWVSDNQRVKSAQQVPTQLKEMIVKCAVPPSTKLEQNTTVKNALGLRNNQKLQRAGIKVIDEPLKVEGRLIAPPALNFGGGQETVHPKENGTWTGGSYLHKAKCFKWYAFSINDDRTNLTSNEWGDFLRRYQQLLTQKGLVWPAPHVEVMTVTGVSELVARINTAARDGAEFCLIAHPDTADHIHHSMKLVERNTEVVTQGVKVTTVRNVLTKDHQHTLENIVNKTNVKMGGANYSLAAHPESAIGDDTLVIGFSVNHPWGGLGMMDFNGNGANGGANGGGNGNGGQHKNGNGKKAQQGQQSAKVPTHATAPSVVGFSANIGQNDAFEFIGGYYFQEPRRDEKVTIISKAVQNCVERFKENRHAYPKRIVIYRNGCSEGFFQHILRYEVPMVKQTLSELSLEKSRITLLVVNKLQSVTLVPSKIDARAKAPDQNLKPGTIVDTCIVHPKWNEFFLNSHVAIQGTARTPKYTVLLDENNYSMDVLQNMTYVGNTRNCQFKCPTKVLCYGHQIVFSPTSLPSPVFVAEEYAKRGRNNYNSTVAAEDVFVTYEEMDQALGLSQTEYLYKLRFNA